MALPQFFFGLVLDYPPEPQLVLINRRRCHDYEENEVERSATMLIRGSFHLLDNLNKIYKSYDGLGERHS